MLKEKVPVIITVTDEALSNMDQVVDQLTARGVEVQQVMPILGAISGLSSASLSELNALEGVQSAEEEQSATLSPPDSQIQ